MGDAAVDQLRDGRVEAEGLEDGRMQDRTGRGVRADAVLKVGIAREYPEERQQSLLRVLVTCDEKDCG